MERPWPLLLLDRLQFGLEEIESNRKVFSFSSVPPKLVCVNQCVEQVLQI